MDWNTEITQHMQSRWASMAEKLAGLNEFNFTRRSFRRTCPSKFCVFCDDSSQAYGFVIYGVQDGISQIIFAKTKVASVKSKSLPTLELLAAFIASKALRFVERCSNHRHLYICRCPSSVILAIKGQYKNKNIFAGNRVKDINGIKNQIEKNSDIRIKYKYVHTTDIPADLISRGIAIAKFENMNEFWSHGPHWVIKNEKEWPTSKLECLFTESKTTVSSKFFYNSIKSYEELIWKKLNEVTSLVYRFLYKCKGRDQTDHPQSGKLYLIKTMPKENFC